VEEHVDAEAPQAFQLQGEVQVQVLLELRLLGVREDVVDHVVDLVPGEGLGAWNRDELPVHPERGRNADGEVQVGSVHSPRKLEERGYVRPVRLY
jgi:hypothetical protein